MNKGSDPSDDNLIQGGPGEQGFFYRGGGGGGGRTAYMCTGERLENLSLYIHLCR